MKKLLISLLVVFTAVSILSAAELNVVRTEGVSVPRELDRDIVEIGYSGDYNGNGIGTDAAGTIYAAARFTDAEIGDYVGGNFQQIKFIVRDVSTDVTVRIFEGATAATTGAMLYEAEITDLVTEEWYTHDITSAVSIEADTEYWVVYEVVCTGGFPIACDDGPAVGGKGDLVSMDGSVWDAAGAAYGLDYNWSIAAVVQSAPAENDVAAISVIGLEGNLEAGTVITPSANVRNIGLSSATFTSTLVIEDLDGTEVYNETSADLTLEVGILETVDMPDFTPEAGKYYNYTLTVNMDSDDDLGNNENTGTFTAYITEREFVVVEVVTGTWCVYCPGAALAMDDFEANGANVAIIEYHGGDDYETPFSAGRTSYYGVESYPTSIFDGVNIHGGGNASSSIYSSLLPLYEDRAATKTAMTLNVTDAARSDFAINVVVTEEGQIPAGDFKLQVAVNESHIQEAWQGQTELNYVNRIMAPSHNGTSLEFVDGVATATVEFSELGWNLDNTEVVIFVQNDDTKEIMQATKLPINSLIPLDASNDAPEMKLELSNYPNPFNPTTTISFNLPTEGQVSLEVFNAKGQKVNTLVNEVKSAGAHSVVWSGTDSRGGGLTSGVYYYKIKTGRFTSTKKMILLK